MRLLLEESDGPSDEEKEEEKINTKLFYQHIAVIGTTPMCKSILSQQAFLVFYVPETACGASDRVRTVIKRHGGICTEFHEGCTIQVKPSVTLDFSSFYTGGIYQEAWIYESVTANKVLKKENYEAGICLPT